MKSNKIYFIVAALGALFLVNIAGAGQLFFNGMFPSPHTNYQYTVGNSIPVSVYAFDGSGSANYLYSWSVASDSPGTCPGFTTITNSPNNAFTYVPSAPTAGCNFTVSAIDSGTKNALTNSTSEQSGTIIVVAALTSTSTSSTTTSTATTSATTSATTTIPSSGPLSIAAPTAGTTTLIVDLNTTISDSGANGGIPPYTYQWLEEDPFNSILKTGSFVAATNCTPSTGTSCVFSTTPALNNPEGVYKFELMATDSAGNTITSSPVSIKLIPPLDFPFNCSSEISPLVFHVHPYLQIVINGQNVVIPGGIGITEPQNATFGGYTQVENGACIEPMHTHDVSGIIHLESPVAFNYTFANFFAIWNDTYKTTNVSGANAPVVFTPGQNILGFQASGASGVVTLVDGHPYNPHAVLNLDKYDYCNMTNGNDIPCFETVGANPDFPFWFFQTYPYGTGHTLEILYTSDPTSAGTPMASNIILDQGQFSTIVSSLPTTGNAPFTFNWMVKTPGNSSFVQVSNTMCATPSGISSDMGANVSCVFATDANTLPGNYSFELQTNSSTSIVNVSQFTNVTVEKDPSIALSVSNTVFYINQSTTISAAVSSGAGPFLISFYFPSSNTLYSGGLGTSGGVATAVFPAFAGNDVTNESYTMNAVGIDTGTSSPFTFGLNASGWVTFTAFPTNATLPSSSTTTSTSTSTTSTSTTSTVGGGGGGGGGGGSTGGGGGGGGGGGSARPIITNISNGFTVNTLAQLGSFGNVWCGQIFHVTNNYITPTSTGVTINGHSYALDLNQSILLYNTPNCYVELTNISYLPILQTVTLKFTNGTTATITANKTNTTSNTTKQFNISFTVSFGVINVNSGNFTGLSAIVNATNDTPNAPFGLEKLAAYNVILTNTVNPNDTINVTMPYTCNITGVEPFILKNGTWTLIGGYKANVQNCTLQFVIPADPVVGLMAPISNQTQLKPTGSNTSGTITPQVQPVIVPTVEQAVNSGIGQAKKDAVAGVLVLAGILALVGGAWSMDRQGGRRKTRKTGNPNAPYKKRRNGF